MLLPRRRVAEVNARRLTESGGVSKTVELRDVPEYVWVDDTLRGSSASVVAQAERLMHHAGTAPPGNHRLLPKHDILKFSPAAVSPNGRLLDRGHPIHRSISARSHERDPRVVLYTKRRRRSFFASQSPSLLHNKDSAIRLPQGSFVMQKSSLFMPCRTSPMVMVRP